MTELKIGDLVTAEGGSLPKPPTMSRHLALAWRDLLVSLIDWRMWLLLGINDIRQRYRRSRLGQFWITLAMAITIITLGFLYAFLFHQPLADYLPYLGTSFVIWSLLSGIVLDACSVFIGAEGYLRQVPLPKSVFVHRMLVRNAITFLHNIIIVPPLYIIFGVPLHWSVLLSLVGIAFVVLNGVWIGLLLGTVCARFRDMPQIVASLLQVAFYITPVMYKRGQLPEKWRWLFQLNPFQSFLDIVREPMLGNTPPLVAWEMCGAVAIVGSVVTALLFSRFRARIIYWL